MKLSHRGLPTIQSSSRKDSALTGLLSSPSTIPVIYPIMVHSPAGRWQGGRGGREGNCTVR